MKLYRYQSVIVGVLIFYLCNAVIFIHFNTATSLFNPLLSNPTSKGSRDKIDITEAHAFTSPNESLGQNHSLLSQPTITHRRDTAKTVPLCTQKYLFASRNTLFEGNDLTLLPQQRLRPHRTHRTPAVCFYHGHFAPVHAGHLHIVQRARQYINDTGNYELLGAYISPAYAGHFVEKLHRADMIGVGHRLSMIELAIADLDWVMVDRFELFHSCYTTPSSVGDAIMSRVRTQLPSGKRLAVFWLTDDEPPHGGIPPASLMRSGFHLLHAMNPRHGESETGEVSAYGERFHVVRTASFSFSSAAIATYTRDSSATYEQLFERVGIAGVVNYILQHHLWRTTEEGTSSRIPTLTPFPTNRTQITSKLLSDMLSVYSIPSVNVSSFSLEEIATGKGMSAHIYRLDDIQYFNTPSHNLSKSFVLKMPKPTVGDAFFGNEVIFYVHLAPSISGIRLPACHLIAKHENSSKRNVYLFEDLSTTHDQFNMLDFQNDSKIFAVISSMAALHAEFYEHPILNQPSFASVPSFTLSLDYYLTKYMNTINDTQFMKQFESAVSNNTYNHARNLLAYFENVFPNRSERHYTLSHCDLHYDNVLRHRNPPHTIVALDWQSVCRSNGLIDVISFLRDRVDKRPRSRELKALEVYHQALVKYGVSSYSMASIRQDYYSIFLPFLFVRHFTDKSRTGAEFDRMIVMLEDTMQYQSSKTY